MTVTLEADRITKTRGEFVTRAADLLGDTAEFARDVARFEARRRTGEMASQIEVASLGEGLDREVVAGDPITIFHEFGTGIYAEGQSSAQTIPWVYYDEYTDSFYTTEGVTPQPMMRPGYEAGKDFLLTEAKRYFD
jgi:hypothetical protein